MITVDAVHHPPIDIMYRHRQEDRHSTAASIITSSWPYPRLKEWRGGGGSQATALWSGGLGITHADTEGGADHRKEEVHDHMRDTGTVD